MRRQTSWIFDELIFTSPCLFHDRGLFFANNSKRGRIQRAGHGALSGFRIKPFFKRSCGGSGPRPEKTFLPPQQLCGTIALKKGGMLNGRRNAKFYQPAFPAQRRDADPRGFGGAAGVFAHSFGPAAAEPGFRSGGFGAVPNSYPADGLPPGPLFCADHRDYGPAGHPVLLVRHLTGRLRPGSVLGHAGYFGQHRRRDFCAVHQAL